MPKSHAMVEEMPAEPVADKTAVEHLQRQVANAFILYANYKHYHWQTAGPLFRDLHLMFDEFAIAVLASLDELAERIRMIGENPIYQPTEVLQVASVRVAQPGTSMREMVREADNNAQTVIREMRRAAKVADEENDPGTVDLFSKTVQIHEKHEWYLRDILKKNDGLVT
jgi:starvation-inducible DNA-binding protein